MDKFESLIANGKKLTKGFTDIRPETIKKYPDAILPLRLVCGLTHLDLTTLYLKKHGKTVRFNPYESGAINVGNKVAERLSEIFKENLPQKINWTDVRRGYDNVIRHSKSHSKGNELENKVKALLIRKNIGFQRNVAVIGKSKIPIMVDFAIPNKLKPKVVIECKVTKGVSGHESFLKARIIALNSIELSKTTKFIGVIDGVWSKHSMALLKNYCEIFTNSEIKQLIDMIEKC